MHPPLPLIVRKCTEDWRIPNTDTKIIKKGTIVYIPTLGLHFNHKIYKDPEIFKPDRFLRNVPFRVQPYLTFGDGGRTCIGLRYALLQIKICALLLVRNFEFHLINNEPIKMSTKSVLLEPESGIQLRVTRRFEPPKTA